MARGAPALHDLFLSYHSPDKALKDVKSMLSKFKELRPSNKPFKHGNGQVEQLVVLEGTIPVTYRGNLYHIPIIIWLHETHPYNAPMVYVQPTATMNIKAGPHVDASGTVTLPYLKDWKQGQSSLSLLVSTLSVLFGESPPVYAIPKGKYKIRSIMEAQTAPAHPPAYPVRQRLPHSTSQTSLSANSTADHLTTLRLNVSIAVEKSQSRINKHTKRGQLLFPDDATVSINVNEQEVAGAMLRQPTLSILQADSMREAEMMKKQAFQLLQTAVDLLDRADAIREEFDK